MWNKFTRYVPFRVPRLVPRFHLRTLIIAVAAAAILMGAIVLVQRSREYQRLATLYGKLEQVGRTQEDAARKTVATRQLLLKTSYRFNDNLERNTTFAEQMKSDAEGAERAAAFAKYGARLRAKYLHAASHPWESVPPPKAPPFP